MKRRKKKVARKRVASLLKKQGFIGVHAKVRRSKIGVNARVLGSAVVTDSFLHDHARACDSSKVVDSTISGDAVVSGLADLLRCSVSGHAVIKGNAVLRECTVGGGAIISGDVELHYANITGQARIARTSDYIAIGPIGTRGDLLTAYRAFYGVDDHREQFHIEMTTGCFTGTVDQFHEALQEREPDRRRDPYKWAIDLIKSHAIANEWYRSE